ncbi:GNAT family N-acetyltransferase [Maribacter sp. CXY002]|uniref:GNAT family N-acetyltransferase n=1 Tax=Maribacter luteocoastalis TaxID=3407671 RepID=UPI003B673388
MDYLLEGEETARLLFRKVLPSDYDSWLPFHQEPKSTQYWDGTQPNPEAACEEQFTNIFLRHKNKTGGMNALILKEHNVLVGLCGLLVQEVDGSKELEIGYSILPKYWGLGFATEAAMKYKEVTKQNKWASHLISIIQIDNSPSQRVAEKNGMKIEKTTSYKNNTVHIFRIDLA